MADFNLYRNNVNLSGGSDLMSSMSLNSNSSNDEDANKNSNGIPLSSPNQKAFTKIGKIIPNRIFIGGLTPDTTENDLQLVFAERGQVRSVKIIYDRQGVSKGYGFITFEKVEDAIRLQNDSVDIIIKNNKIKISKAVKKQHVYDLFHMNYAPGGIPMSMQLERMNATGMQNPGALSPMAYVRALQHQLIPNAAPPQVPHQNSLCGIPPPLNYGGVFMPPNGFPKHLYGKINPPSY